MPNRAAPASTNTRLFTPTAKQARKLIVKRNKRADGAKAVATAASAGMAKAQQAQKLAAQQKKRDVRTLLASNAARLVDGLGSSPLIGSSVGASLPFQKKKKNLLGNSARSLSSRAQSNVPPARISINSESYPILRF